MADNASSDLRRPPTLRPAPPSGVPALTSACLLWVVFVVYGSLVPLDFQALPWDEALARFARMPMLHIGIEGRADWIANAVLYLPVGFLAAAALLARRAGAGGRFAALLEALVFGAVLAVAVEFAQLYFPPRTVSRNDILAEWIGTALGVLLASRWGASAHDLLASLQGRAAGLLLRLLPAYGLLYVALSLFPYDLLLSSAELADKIHSNLWGWWLAPINAEAAVLRLAARLGTEVLTAAPLGWLLARRGRPHGPASLAAIAAAGALLGLVLEVAQLFIASGVSQGLSVLTRGAGFFAGAWLWQRRADWHAYALRAAIARVALPLALAQALLAMALSGWFASRWLGPDAALARLLTDEVRFVPFYYHYYTTEAIALASLLSVALLYAPAGLLAWARGWRRGRAALATAALAAVVEAGKLLHAEIHPDPSNVFIAAASAWAVVVLIELLSVRHAGAARPAAGAAGAGTLAPAGGLRLSPLGSPVVAPVVLAVTAAVAAGWLVSFPLHSIVCAALLWWRPIILFALLPIALPLLDLAPWSGRVFFDEFDLLLSIGLAIGYARTRPPQPGTNGDRWLLGALVLVAGSVAISTVRALLPWQMPSADALDNPLSPLHALQISKGALWALLLYGLARRLIADGAAVARTFGAGMVLGLAGTVCFIVWERAAFAGLMETGAPYRVSGPFAAMQTGGAYVECFIVAALPFAMGGLYAARTWLARAALAAVLGGAVYALALTFSRGGYAAGAVALLLMAAATARGAARRGRAAGLTLAAFAGLAGVAYPIVSGPVATQRLATVERDFGIRDAHWHEVWNTRDDDGWSWLFGMGVGRYPETRYWRSPEDKRTAVHRFARERGEAFLRLGPGLGLYVDQIVAIDPGVAWRLAVDARSLGPPGQLAVELCHKWLLAAFDCALQTFEVGAGGKQWTRLAGVLDSAALGNDPWYARRPVRLSLFNAGPSLIEVDRIELIGPDGRDRLHNGDFAAGGDRWTFTSDDHLGWHVKTLPLALFFDQGLFGLLAVSSLLLLAFVRGARSAWHGSLPASAVSAALAGFMIVGAFDTLIDTPRFLLLLLVLAWLAASDRGPGTSSRR